MNAIKNGIAYLSLLVKSIYIRIFSTKVSRKIKKNRVVGKGNDGCLYHIGDLLDGLDDYFKNIKEIKKIDPDAYHTYRNVGGQVVNGNTTYDMSGDIEPYWAERMPAFGMAHFNGGDVKVNSDNDIIPIRFGYYKKLERPYYVQNHSDTTYEVTHALTWENSRSRKSRRSKMVSGVTYHVSMSGGGKIRLLKEVVEKKVAIKHKNGGSTSFMRTYYEYPELLKDSLMDLQSRGNFKDVDIHEFARISFCSVANIIVRANAGLQIFVTKGSLSCVFNIDMLRTPYFFKDREKTVNHNGKTKKIYHIVRTHKRKTGNGDIFIKTHFRGLRRFDWNGYVVDIKDPKNRLDTLDFDCSGKVHRVDEEAQGWSMNKVSKFVREHAIK
jgi:hypothetical protein